MEARGGRQAHQFHCQGINLSDFYVNSIHFIYSPISVYLCIYYIHIHNVCVGKGACWMCLDAAVFNSMFDVTDFLRPSSVFAQIFAKLICNFSKLALSPSAQPGFVPQQISCGAHKLCANKLPFVKWLCIRSSFHTSCMYSVSLSVCLSVVQPALLALLDRT